MKKKPKIELKTEGFKTTILIDGKEISGARTVHFSHEAGKVASLTITLTAIDLNFDGNIIPDLPYPFTEFYERKKEPSEDGDED